MAISYEHLVTVANKAFETLIKGVNLKRLFSSSMKLQLTKQVLALGKL
jgi:hypothetical protein